MFEDDEIVERENADWRICQEGLGAELIRRGELPEVNARWEAHLSHIKMVDIVALKKAFWLTEQDLSSVNYFFALTTTISPDQRQLL